MNWKVAPRSELPLAHKLPPCDSIIVPADRQSHAGALRFGGEKCIKYPVRLIRGSPMPESLTEINS